MNAFERTPHTDYDESKVLEHFRVRALNFYNKNWMAVALPPSLKNASTEQFREFCKNKATQRANKDYNNLLENIPDDHWLIPKENWVDVTEFFGTRAKAIFHYQFNELWFKALQKYEATSENLILFSCSGAKPYSKNSTYKKYINKAKKYKCFDIAIVSSPNPVLLHPLDTSIQYPNIFYDFPHVESKELEDLMVQNNVQCLSYLINKHKYKKVILISLALKYYSRIIDDLRILHPNVEFIHPSRSIMFDLALKIFGGAGLASLRFTLSTPAALTIFASINRLDIMNVIPEKTAKIMVDFFKNYGISNIFNEDAKTIAEFCNDIKYPREYIFKQLKK